MAIGENYPSQSGSISGHDVEYRVYMRRWIMLIVTSFLNFANAMLWISYAPVANYTDVFYCGEVNNTQTDPINATSATLTCGLAPTSTSNDCGAANYLSLVFMICAIPFGFLAMWGVDRFGLRSGILIGTWATTVGAVIRVVSSIDSVPVSARFPLVMLGQCIAACAQPFIMYLPPKLAQLWFPQNQRALANTCGSMANPLGILVSMVIGPYILTEPNRMLLLNGVACIPCVIVSLMATFTVCSSVPPTPPTSSAAEISLPFWDGFKRVWRNKPFMILTVCLGGGIGLFNSVYTLIQQILCPKGYSNEFAGMCGALLIAGGLIASALAGVFVDKTKLFQEVMKISFGLAALASCFFAIISLHEGLASVIAVSCVVFGAFGFAVFPIGLELGVECTYPVAEATSAGLIIMSGQIQGIILVLVLTALQTPLAADSADCLIQKCTVGSDAAGGVEANDMLVPNMVWAGVAALLAGSFMLFFWPRYYRMEAERNMQERTKDLLNSSEDVHDGASSHSRLAYT